MMMTGKRNFYRAVTAVLLLLCMILPAAAGTAEGPDYHAIGLEVAGVMDEMVRSREYLNMFLYSENSLELVDSTFNTGDYHTPVAVYRLNQTDPQGWLMAQMKDSDREQFDALSPVLQNQIRIRMESLAVISNYFNAQRGVDFLSVASAIQARLEKPELEEEKARYYLYVFEKGIPILVSFGYHGAVGTFIGLTAEQTASPEALQLMMLPMGIEAEQVFPETPSAD